MIKQKKSDSSNLKVVAERLSQFRPTKLGYSVQELIRLTDLSRPQVLNLEKAGLVLPTRRKPSRKSQRSTVFYSVQEVLKALLISDMRHAKFSLQQVREVIKNVESLGSEFDATTFLLTDGFTIHVANNEHEVIDVLRHNRQMLLLVSIGDQILKLQKLA